MIRVLIADDSAAARATLRLVLESGPLVCVCGEATCGAEAIQKAIELKPHVAVLDLRLPDRNGIEAASRISVVVPGTLIALISAYPGLRVEGAISEVGVSAFFSKSEFSALRSWILTLFTHRGRSTATPLSSFPVTPDQPVR
jgi:DNA-binding NarL/FixJ family response regulator